MTDGLANLALSPTQDYSSVDVSNTSYFFRTKELMLIFSVHISLLIEFKRVWGRFCSDGERPDGVPDPEEDPLSEVEEEDSWAGCRPSTSDSD